MDLEGLVMEVQNMKNCPIIDVESCMNESLLNTNSSQMCCGDDILPDGFMVVHQYTYADHQYECDDVLLQRLRG